MVSGADKDTTSLPSEKELAEFKAVILDGMTDDQRRELLQMLKKRPDFTRR